MKLVEKENNELASRLVKLEQMLERFEFTHTKQESMLRKQLFRLTKENAQLSAKLNLMEENQKEQVKVSKALMKVVLKIREIDFEEPEEVAQQDKSVQAGPIVWSFQQGRKLNFRPIYD